MVVDDGSGPADVPESDDASGAAAPDTADAPDELTLARELILKAHPSTVHELVAGNSLAELLASVPLAEAAFARVVAAHGAEAHPTTAVPGGGAVRSTSVNVEGLGPLAKIRAGISRS